MRFIVGALVVLHGLVHLLYFGQCWRLFELQPNLVWPNGSWVFSKLLRDKAIRLLASISCILAAIGFVAGGVAILSSHALWRPLVVGAAAFSSLVFVLFWDGKIHKLDGQGGIGLLINVVILISVLILRWPDFAF